jgi:hypothetical protein
VKLFDSASECSCAVPAERGVLPLHDYWVSI